MVFQQCSLVLLEDRLVQLWRKYCVLAITKIYSIYVIGGAAVIAIILSFIGKFSALISSIPTPVMGGVSILLFGIIAASGLRMLVESRVDFASNRNLVIASVVLVVGIGNLLINLKSLGVNLQIEGMALAALSGIILNLILPKEKKNQTLNKRGSFRRQVMKNLFSMEYLTNDDIFNLIQTASRFKSEKKLSSV